MDKQPTEIEIKELLNEVSKQWTDNFSKLNRKMNQEVSDLLDLFISKMNYDSFKESNCYPNDPFIYTKIKVFEFYNSYSKLRDDLLVNEINDLMKNELNEINNDNAELINIEQVKHKIYNLKKDTNINIDENGCLVKDDYLKEKILSLKKEAFGMSVKAKEKVKSQDSLNKLKIKSFKEEYIKLVNEYNQEFNNNKVYKKDIDVLRSNKDKYIFTEVDKNNDLKNQKEIEKEKNLLMIKVFLITSCLIILVLYGFKYLVKSVKV